MSHAYIIVSNGEVERCFFPLEAGWLLGHRRVLPPAGCQSNQYAPAFCLHTSDLFVPHSRLRIPFFPPLHSPDCCLHTANLCELKGLNQNCESEHFKRLHSVSLPSSSAPLVSAQESMPEIDQYGVQVQTFADSGTTLHVVLVPADPFELGEALPSRGLAQGTGFGMFHCTIG